MPKPDEAPFYDKSTLLKRLAEVRAELAAVIVRIDDELAKLTPKRKE